MEQKYYIGLDIGTNSVGWAVTDEEYNLLRAKGKDLWGVRLFDKAETSAERRSHRTARRRLQREKLRNAYVRDIFADAVNAVDPGFFQRLQDSKYFREDKTEQQKYALFNGNGFTDREYYDRYPTISHLRSELLHDSNPHDVRLVYLAVLNIFKHRGHFLNENLDAEGGLQFNDLLNQFHDLYQDYTDFEIDCSHSAEMEEILSSKDYSNSAKAEMLLKLLGLNKKADKGLYELIKMMCGLKGNISVIFPTESDDEDYGKLSFSFRDSTFEEKYAETEDKISEEAMNILDLVKQIHDTCLLANIMRGEDRAYDYLSEARVGSYEKHKRDLSVLKRYLRSYASPDEYDAMFRKMEDNNYSAYVGSVNYQKGKISEKERRGAKGQREEFYKRIQKLIKDLPDCDDKQYILEEIKKENFLPKQLTSANGVIPYQLHKKELVRILELASAYLPFLNEVDESGFSARDRLVMMFEFRLPYYVGPLFNDGNGTGWAVRREAGRVFPWNISQKINLEESAEKFIGQMVKKCSYLSDEQVLPKNSLLYEKFMVLNELNNLVINGVPISTEWKQALYTEKFRKGKKVTQKTINNWLRVHAYIGKNETADIRGIDGDFKNTLVNYAKFAAIFETDVLTWEQEKTAEKIIFWATVYGDSRDFLKKRIKEEFSETLTPVQMKKVLKLRFKDWGRLSKAFLELEGADRETGEVRTIISRMWDENYNLMQLLSNHFTYVEEVEERSGKLEKDLSEIKYEDLEGQYLNAPVRRMVWQTILVVRELVNVLGSEPEKIFVEMARDKELDPQRTVSRKKKLEAAYKKKAVKEDKELLDSLSSKEEKDLKWKKLYLYYQQKGRCMYTGEPINIEDLASEKYDIDHIYPRHFVKDDSLENNLILVKKVENAHKSDSFPIESRIQNRLQPMWKMLVNQELISREKYNRLTRTQDFTAEEQTGFIARQLVETRQGTKAVAGIFSSIFGNGRTVYVKAGNVSAFRHQFDLLKCREVNDLHHAQDAYLNIIVGNAYDVKFTRNPRRFIEEYRKNPKANEYHMYKLFENSVIRGDITAWDTRNDKSIRIVKSVMRKNTPLVTVRTEEVHGQLFDQQIVNAEAVAKGESDKYLSIKTSENKLADTSKYGGYNKVTGAYFFLVEHTQKKKRVRTLESVPLHRQSVLVSKKQLEQYCIKELGYEYPSVRVSRIKKNSLFKTEGYYQYVTGRSGNQLVVNNAVQLILSYEDVSYVKTISKFLEDGDNPQSDIEYYKERNRFLYQTLMNKFISGIYQYRRPTKFGAQLQEGEELYNSLPIMDQFYVLKQIISLVQMKARGADLTKIGMKKQSGVSMLTKRLSDYEDVVLINQSVTGLFESRIDLLKV